MNEKRLKVLTQLNLIEDNLISYLKLKVESKDWHGVADAAMDLREVTAKREILMEQEHE